MAAPWGKVIPPAGGVLPRRARYALLRANPILIGAK